MDLHQQPTLTDVAQLLDTIHSGASGGYPATQYVLRRLIQRSPAAREIHDRLHAPREGEPSLIELARLMIAVESNEDFPEALYTVHWLIARSKKAAELYRRLEQMARDAGVDVGYGDWAVQALEVNAELDRLLATLDDWQDAAAELRPKKGWKDAPRHLLLVCRARIARADGEGRERLERLRRRLQAAAAACSRDEDPEERLRELETALLSMKDPAAVLATVEALGRRQPSP